jgi:phosphoribosylglycinamide formyltransferase 2
LPAALNQFGKPRVKHFSRSHRDQRAFKGQFLSIIRQTLRFTTKKSAFSLFSPPFISSYNPISMSDATTSNIYSPRQIGTPLSPSATKVMLLGSGELGKEVIIALQRLGVEVIAVDRYENAPGQQVAHRAYVIDMTDETSLRNLIAEVQPDLIVPEIEAIATPALVELEREGKANVIPTARAAWLTMNREGIRRLAAETLALPTSNYRFANSLAELQAACDEIGFPCIIKPVMSSSGKGQSKIDAADEVEAAWLYAAAGGRVNSGRVIVEGFIDFDYEITLLTVRAINADGQVETQFCEPIGHVQVDGDYVESWQPQIMSTAALERARHIAKAVTDNLGGLGLFGVELFVKGDMVWFSEVSPRPHDTGMVTMASQVQSEFEIHAKAILGLPVNVCLKTPAASAVIYGQHDAKAIAFEGVADALRIPSTDVRLFGKPESFSRRRMGVALASAVDTDTARVNAKAAAAKVKPVL